MELTYTVRGPDGQDYGPVNLEQLSGWISEGRIVEQSEILRSDTELWSSAGNFDELKSSFHPASAPAPAAAATTPGAISAPDRTTGDAVTQARLKSGASWFYWVAGLSLINSIVAFTGSDWRFMLGLGITQILDAMGTQIGGSGKIVVLLLNLVVAGVFILFGVFANKRHLWAFITGMVLFTLDGLIFLVAQDWLGVAFHVFVLYCFFRGVKACRELNAD